jgi:hypothetical protein
MNRICMELDNFYIKYIKDLFMELIKGQQKITHTEVRCILGFDSMWICMFLLKIEKNINVK